jgi:Carboxypeptidase regulatory-like domain
MTAILACLALILFQGGQAPKPASIEGYVRRVGTGEPVAKARVLLSGGPQTTTPAPGQITQKSLITDRSGHFVFANLPPGRYNLTAFANGYVRMGYSQKAQNLPGTPILLQAGEEVKDVLFEMDPTGTITGRIYDFDNLPLPSADVTLQKSAYDPSGQRTLQTVQQTRTNDLGEYRLFWISPGKYFLRVDYSSAPTPLSRNPNEYIGPVNDGYAAMYYPGTTDPARAIEIDVLPGTEMGAIDLTLLRTKTVTVRGRVIVNVPNMAKARPSVSLRPRQPVGPTMMTSMNTTMQPDGTFEIRAVVPGSYTLAASVGTGITNTF